MRILCLGILWVAGVAAAAPQVDTDGFVNPLEARKHFEIQLGDMMDQKMTLPTEVLKKRMEEEATTTVELPKMRTRKMPREEVYRKGCPGVVQVGSLYRCGNKKCNKWHANVAGGWVLTEDGIIVSNYHVLSPGSRDKAAGIMTYDGRVFPVKEVLAADEHNDIAVFRVEADDLKPLPLATESRVGQTIYGITHPVGRFYTFTEGMVSGKFVRRTKEGSLRELTITADFAKGSSGSPILDDSGRVVGMVRSTSSVYYEESNGEQRNLQMVWKQCVPVEEIRALINQP